MVTPAYRLKLERAKHHIAELTQAIDAFHASEPYVVFTEDNRDTGQRVWKLRIQKALPERFSTIVGDAIHNARVALDLLMVAVVRHCDPGRESYNHVHFVIRESREEFESALPRNIKGSSAAAKAVIETLEPYKGGNEAFWRLHQLDILDKHKAIIPVGAGYRSFGITFALDKLFESFSFPKPDEINLPTVFLKPPAISSARWCASLCSADCRRATSSQQASIPI